MVPGHAPDRPLLGAEDEVITLGSCFASELRQFLNSAGLGASRIRIPERLNNTYALLDFVTWCITGSETARAYSYDKVDGDVVGTWAPEAKRERYARTFASAGAFVFTVGLAEVWEDRESGRIFWRGIPRDMFDESRHVFRVTTVEENLANLRSLVELVRQANATAPIVVTLSPVPLEATFRDMSCMTADCVSKSVLRVAIDRLMDEKLPGVHYWPSFEIVRWAGAHYPYPAYGFDDALPRHVNRYLVGEIIRAFIGAYYRPDAVARLQQDGTAAVASVPVPTSLRGRILGLRSRRGR